MLVCNNFAGMMNSKITFLAIDYQTGETVETAPEITGQDLTTIPVPEKNLVIFVAQTFSGKDDGVYLLAHDLDTGVAKWSTKFTKSGGFHTIHGNLDRYNSYTEKAAKRAGGSKSSQAYSYILTTVEKDIGVVGVNLATGETDRTITLKEKEPEYTVDEPMNRVFHFKGKNTVVAYQF